MSNFFFLFYVFSAVYFFINRIFTMNKKVKFWFFKDLDKDSICISNINLCFFSDLQIRMLLKIFSSFCIPYWMRERRTHTHAHTHARTHDNNARMDMYMHTYGNVIHMYGDNMHKGATHTLCGAWSFTIFGMTCVLFESFNPFAIVKTMT